MKTIISILFIIVFVPKINAQNTELYSSKIFEAQKSIEFDKSINLFDSFDFLIRPQFGGLFNESFKHVKGITNLKMIFNDFDLAFNLGFNYKLFGKISLKAAYKVGILKFENQDNYKIPGAYVKVAFNYKF